MIEGPARRTLVPACVCSTNRLRLMLRICRGARGARLRAQRGEAGLPCKREHVGQTGNGKLEVEKIEVGIARGMESKKSALKVGCLVEARVGGWRGRPRRPLSLSRP